MRSIEYLLPTCCIRMLLTLKHDEHLSLVDRFKHGLTSRLSFGPPS